MTRAVLILAAAASLQAHDVISTKITWSREVSRIVYKRCATCHREGGPAFSLMTYDEARPWAKAIKEEVLARRMPPWNAVKGFGDLKNDVGLTQEQLEVIADWVEGGAPEGNPQYLPSRPRLGSEPEPPPPGDPVTVSGSLTLRTSAEFAGIRAGKLQPGASVQVTAVRPDGVIQPLLWVANFNPGYDQPYYFATPLRLPAGSRIEVSPPRAPAIVLLRQTAARSMATEHQLGVGLIQAP